jgi:hypothetical protein
MHTSDIVNLYTQNSDNIIEDKYYYLITETQADSPTEK